MKKILAALILGSLSSLAAAMNVCGGGAADKVAVAPAGTPVFIRTGFSFNCSSNSIVVYTEQSTTLLTVGATSVKGSEYFGGHTDGGAVKSLGTCTDLKLCKAEDAAEGDTKAKADAESAATSAGGETPPAAD